MTGETSDRALTFEAALVQIKHHLNHAPGGQLRGLVIFTKTIRHVAITALHAERAGDESHGGLELCRRKTVEDLDVLESLLGSLLLLRE